MKISDKKSPFHALIGMSLILILVLTACGTQTEQAPDSQSVTVQLSWTHEYSSSMFVAAKQQGIFENYHLDVSLIEGGFGENGFIDAVKTVVNGNAQFGITDGFRLIEARAEGLPVVAIASVLQRSPNAIISLAESDIVRPQDMLGQRILVASGGANLLFGALLESQAIDTDALDIVPRTAFGIEPVVTGEADALMGWITNEVIIFEEEGQDANYILFSDYGIENYNFVLFTTEEMIENQPETVQNMVNSVIEGVEFIIGNPEQAIADTLVFNGELDSAAQLRRLQATIPLMNVPGIPIGSMSEEIWNFSAEVLKAQEIIDNSFDVSSVFTLDFLGSDS